jgi:putative toxin-antitoxin system antitoxin component (TIGR02293 family)
MTPTNQTNFEERLNQEINSLVNQPGAAYLRTSIKQNITLDEFFEDKMLIINAIRAGIPYSFFRLIQMYVPFSENEWAGFLDISTKSLQRYKTAGNFNFKPIHSEKIIEMAEVTRAGLEVFGDIDKLKLWLNTPNFALGNHKPIDLLRDSYGKDMVMSELIRISHGIFI